MAMSIPMIIVSSTNIHRTYRYAVSNSPRIFPQARFCGAYEPSSGSIWDRWRVRVRKLGNRKWRLGLRSVGLVVNGRLEHEYLWMVTSARFTSRVMIILPHRG